jgi:hypothetical protein
MVEPFIPPEFLPPRDEFRSSGPDAEDVARSTLTLHRVIDNYPLDDPIQIADMVRIQSVNLADEERTQIVVNNVDSGKLYLFGRQPRLYTVSAFIIDSNLDPLVGTDSAIYAGSSHLLSEWLALYEEHFRLTKCLDKSTIARLRWRTSEYWGYLTSNVRSGESTNQNLIVVSFSFLHVSGEEHVDLDTIESDEGDTIEATISREGYEFMVRNLYGEPWKDEPANSPVSKYIEGRRRVP